MVRCGWMKEKDSDGREGGCFVEGFFFFSFCWYFSDSFLVWDYSWVKRDGGLRERVTEFERGFQWWVFP